MALEKEIYQPEVAEFVGGDPDPLGLRKKAASMNDPLGLRAKHTNQSNAPKAFQINLSDPSFKSVPAQTGTRTFSDQLGIDPFAITKLQKKATEAKTKLDVELHGNEAEYEKKLREYRRDNFTMDDLVKESKKLGYIIPIGKEKEALRLAKQRQYELPVTKEDISDIRTGTILNTGASRNFIRDLKKPEVQKNAYLVDAYNHASQDIDGQKRVPKIKENAEKIGNGQYVYDPVNKILGKKEGVINSIISGRSDLNKSFDFYTYLQTAPDASIISTLNNEMAGDIDEPISIPEDKMAEIGRMMGSQPLKSLLAGGVSAIGVTALGNPEAAPAAFNLANAGVSAIDMYKIGKANAVKANYFQFKNQGIPDQEALNKARSLAENQANVDAATAALMSYGAGKLAFKPTGLTLNTLKKSLGGALTQIGEAGAKKTLEGLGVGTIGGVGQIIKNIQAQNAGLPVESTEGFKEQLDAGMLLTLTTHIIAKSSTALKPSTLNKLTKALSKMPSEVIESDLNNQQQHGIITEEEAKVAQNRIQDMKAINESVPTDIPESDRQKIISNIQERNRLNKELENVDEFKHPEIKEKIKKLNDESLAILKGSGRGELQSLVNKEINAGNVHGMSVDPLRNASEKELQSYFKDISEQAHDPATEKATIEAFGEEIVNKAKELYPKTENTETNASTIRSDEGQISLPGIDAESGQKQSGSNIQQPEGTPSINAETEQQAGGRQEGSAEGNTESEKIKGQFEKGGGIPPEMFDLPFTPEMGDVGRLAHQDTEKLYRDLGMTDRIPRATKNDVTLEGEADNLIRNGFDFEGKADRILSGRDNKFTDAEQVAFAKMVGALNIKLEGLEPNSPEFNSTYETIERLSRASDKVGSETGAALRARRMFVLNDETLSSFLNKAKEANLDVPLNDEQISSVRAKFEDMKASRDAYRARLEKLAAEKKKTKAESNISKIKSEKNPETKDYKTERKQILDDISKKWNESKGRLSASIIPIPIDRLIEIAPDVMKLVRNVVSEGVDKLPDIINAVHKHLKQYIPDITEQNVHDIIAGEYSKKQTKSDISEKLYNLRLQAKLINKVEALRAGVQPKGERARIRRSAEIEDLKKQIKDLTERPEKTDDQKLSALKARYKKQIEDLQKKIDTGDFEPDEKTTLELDKEAQDLKDAYIKKKIEWQKYVAEEKFKNRTAGEKARDVATEILGIPRTIMASADLSAPLRQGLLFTASHPIIAAKAFTEAIKQVADPARFDRWLYDLKESDYYKNVIEPSGVYIADPNNLHLSAKEEQFMTNMVKYLNAFAKKLGPIGKLVKLPSEVIAGSERHYVAYLNKLRVDVFTRYATALAEDGITPQNRPDIYEALGSFVNNATGRGELGDLERSAQTLNSIFFSPRLIASRINLLNPVYYASLPKAVRIMALKDMGKMIGLGALTVGLFSLIPGSKTETNPNSPDFGKIHFGNTRWDIWGGFQQYIRLISQMISGYEKKSNGDIVPLGGEFGQNNRGDKLISFFRGKLAPIPSISADVLTGKTAIGEPVEFKSEFKEHLIPMIGNDVSDAWKEQGPMSIIYTGIPSFLGVGTTTYEPKESSGKSNGKSGKHGKPSKHSKNKK